ncbi:hypothetical protein GCM10010495_69580 [Kitasatospora herbaricolor]|uniref:hypothetical protein n=1 Tax=Kitasatospora herbaricolor TaxID=68217 RepID=UPI0019A91B4A|nr:hypothetical protein [Kitasatospora herbaricolor]MDQ0313327.1 hypothetical protein [Kitasatospora herbaricolor]GGV42015.1 hypothetical protein GCM10010495_69580 [Kitasatospora herbaricolor]
MSESATIELDGSTYARVRLLALAWKVSEGEAVKRLMEHFEQPLPAQAPVPPAKKEGQESVPVHARYEGNLIPGLYYPASQALEITEGPAVGRYKSPSGAATAVLRAYNPKVSPHRNGWSFFVVDGSGEFLQSVRRPVG